LPIHPVLARIIQKKEEEIFSIPLYKNLDPAKLSLKKSLESKPKSIIAECKKGSPSAGIIRKDYNAKIIGKIYESCGARAISVLTDREFFYGSLEDLKQVSESVDIPVIRKDFIISEKQIDEARHFGASAILLIVRILSPEKLEKLHSHSKSLGMDVLVETHNEEEIKISLDSGVEIIGINTRDLDTFVIHEDLIEKLSSLIPPKVLKIGESGIKSREGLEKMFQYVNSALIGTFFMEKQDIAKSFHDLVIN
jgi:indole-3-glycerol phosphate synthase